MILNENLTYFDNVYEFGKEFENEQEAINFANQNDWTKEIISPSKHAVGDYCLIDNTKDNKIIIYYDYDWDSFFFVSNKNKE